MGGETAFDEERYWEVGPPAYGYGKVPRFHGTPQRSRFSSPFDRDNVAFTNVTTNGVLIDKKFQCGDGTLVTVQE
jgi:hypothetical protein